MNRKLIAVAALIILVAAGASAELMLGVTGALHMDTKLEPEEIKARFESGEGIFYGPFLEITGRKMGLGIAGNFSFYDDDWTVLGMIYPMMEYDVTGYLSYHLFGAHALLDPFGEIGGGVIANDFADEAQRSDPALNPYADFPLYASPYWYAALGAGINLGPLGIFGKFSFNFAIDKRLETEWKDELGGGPTEVNPYGYDAVLNPEGYLPNFRFTLGAKLIL